MFLAPASCRRKQGRTRVAPWWLRTPHARRGRREDEHTETECCSDRRLRTRPGLEAAHLRLDMGWSDEEELAS